MNGIKKANIYRLVRIHILSLKYTREKIYANTMKNETEPIKITKQSDTIKTHTHTHTHTQKKKIYIYTYII